MGWIIDWLFPPEMSPQESVAEAFKNAEREVALLDLADCMLASLKGEADPHDYQSLHIHTLMSVSKAREEVWKRSRLGEKRVYKDLWQLVVDRYLAEEARKERLAWEKALQKERDFQEAIAVEQREIQAEAQAILREAERYRQEAIAMWGYNYG